MATADPHRVALDHVLAVVANSDWGAGMVLRGSMTLLAWLGPEARPPGDLDWIVLEPQFCDPLDPYPFLDSIETVQQWPEADDGAARSEIWTDEDFDTFGLRPKLPPEGLRWIRADEFERPSLQEDLTAAISCDPFASDDVTLNARGIHTDEQWPYFDSYGSTGTRLIVPWDSEDYGSGQLHLDFAVDHTLPDPPVWTAIPRADGRPPTPVPTASRELSLAWKLLWLHTDATESGHANGKDLYDAVLLAESPHTALTARLLRTVLGTRTRDLTPTAMRDWEVDWTDFRASHPGVSGELGDWLDRLVRALEPNLALAVRKTTRGADA